MCFDVFFLFYLEVLVFECFSIEQYPIDYQRILFDILIAVLRKIVRRLCLMCLMTFVFGDCVCVCVRVCVCV